MLVQSFIAELKELGAKEHVYPTGDYGEFEIAETGDILPMHRGCWFMPSFILNYSGNITDVEQLIKKYVFEHGRDLRIYLFTDKGEEFRSWTYEN